MREGERDRVRDREKNNWQVFELPLKLMNLDHVVLQNSICNWAFFSSYIILYDSYYCQETKNSQLLIIFRLLSFSGYKPEEEFQSKAPDDC